MKLILTASNINSIAISSTIRFFRLRKMPTTLIAKRSAPTPRYQDSETISPPLLLLGACNRPLTSRGIDRHRDQAQTLFAAHLGLLGGTLKFGVLAPPQRERDRRDDGDQQDRPRDLQR